jgi:hypothetical protein
MDTDLRTEKGAAWNSAPEDEKETFASSLRDLKRAHIACTTRAVYLQKLADCEETIRLADISRCQETYLQIVQAHSRAVKLFQVLGNHHLGNRERIAEIHKDATTVQERARQNLALILGWAVQVDVVDPKRVERLLGRQD